MGVGIESITSDKKFAEKIVDTISKYSNYKPPKGTRGVEAKLDAFIEHVTDNLLWLYDQVDVDTRERSKLWYEGANRIANEFSTRYNISVEQVAAVMASLSPQKDWFQNVSLAERVIDIAVTKADNRWSDEMTETAKRIFGKPQYADMLKAVEGKTLREIDDTALQALWIRTYDQTFNTRSYRLVSPEGIFQDIVTTAKG